MSSRTVNGFYWTAALLLGACFAWDTRHLMDTDGISYLDVGDAYFRGDWANAINAFWSPLYSWLLGLAMWFLKPSPYWEFPVVHLVNYLIFLGGAAAFDFFLRQFLSFHREKIAEARRQGSVALSENLIRILGASLFLWTSLHLVDLATVTPDLCTMAIFFWIMGILLKIRGGGIHPFHFFVFGLALGLGYLARTSMFFMAFVFLAAGTYLVRKGKGSFALPLITLIGFGLVVAPFVAALSLQKGRWTYGDVGTLHFALLNYAVLTHNHSKYSLDHWRGEPPGMGSPTHPTRKISDHPAVYEFATPVGGTFPLWFDPSYWREGVHPSFEPRAHLHIFRTVFGNQLPHLIFGRWRWFLVFALLFLFYLGGNVRAFLSGLGGYGIFWMPLLIAWGLNVIFPIEPRRLAPSLALSWLFLFGAVRLPVSPLSQRCLRGIILAVAGAMWISLALPASRALARGAQEWVSQEYRSGHRMWKIAQQLNAVGIVRGDWLATIGEGNVPSQWARLARVRIVAEVPEADAFWSAPPARRWQTAQALKQAGIKALIAESPPSLVREEGWRQIGVSHYYAKLL